MFGGEDSGFAIVLEIIRIEINSFYKRVSLTNDISLCLYIFHVVNDTIGEVKNEEYFSGNVMRATGKISCGKQD